MPTYLFFTFAPVQGFIEKSRKLRDLYGASQILSHLSNTVVGFADNDLNLDVISPTLIRVQSSSERERSGVPNRILLKGSFPNSQEIEKTKNAIKDSFFAEWRKILVKCKEWVEEKLEQEKKKQRKNYPSFIWYWDEEWNHWAQHSWELFFGVRATIPAAIEDLEGRKLKRNWIAINWISESSSLSGTDGIAFPGLGGISRNPQTANWSEERDNAIRPFYRYLAFLLDNPQYRQRDLRQISPSIQPEGRYVAANEKLSIPELTKRLVTYRDISNALEMSNLERFNELVRRAKDNPNGTVGQWTGWFMGDGDYLTSLAERPDGDSAIQEFSQTMRNWGSHFYNNFPEHLGRVVYAGGDDFLGVIYNKDFPKCSRNSINTLDVLEWLMQLPQEWQWGKSDEINRNITLSLGFVWAAPGVPQRDILQHCREAEKRSKSQGRKRVTIRIVFSSGQYVQWTTPWKYLEILQNYKDRDGEKNWSHVYTDLAQLKARHAFGFSYDDPDAIPDDIVDNYPLALNFFEIYFPNYLEKLKQDKKLFEYSGNTAKDRYWEAIRWIHDLIQIGWYICTS